MICSAHVRYVFIYVGRVKQMCIMMEWDELS
jgi:hypothetical protein